MTDFKQLKVWQKAHDLTLAIYRTTSTFPKEELCGLTSQMRRCAVSIGSNIAEGRGRDGDPDFQRFIAIAIGSSAELEYQVLLSRDFGISEPGTIPRASHLCFGGRQDACCAAVQG